MTVLDRPEPLPNDLTELLARADQADQPASDELFALLYEELRCLAERHLRRRWTEGSSRLGVNSGDIELGSQQGDTADRYH